ncbi:MAG: response regulator [Acidobacteriota bacterium]
MAKAADKYVLVVDDEEDVAYFLVTALQDVGFQAESAGSVDEALARLEARAADLVSLDMVMPGKSGIVLFHELRKRPEWRRIPVLFVTGHARDERVKRDLDAAAAFRSCWTGPGRRPSGRP